MSRSRDRGENWDEKRERSKDTDEAEEEEVLDEKLNTKMIQIVPESDQEISPENIRYRTQMQIEPETSERDTARLW